MDSNRPRSGTTIWNDDVDLWEPFRDELEFVAIDGDGSLWGFDEEPAWHEYDRVWAVIPAVADPHPLVLSLAQVPASLAGRCYRITKK